MFSTTIFRRIGTNFGNRAATVANRSFSTTTLSGTTPPLRSSTSPIGLQDTTASFFSQFLSRTGPLLALVNPVTVGYGVVYLGQHLGIKRENKRIEKEVIDSVMNGTVGSDSVKDLDSDSDAVFDQPIVNAKDVTKFTRKPSTSHMHVIKETRAARKNGLDQYKEKVWQVEK